MPSFGICTPIENAPAVKAAGWEYVEEVVVNFIQGRVPDEQWKGLERLARSPLPVPAANVLVPAQLKITGPEADLDALRRYMQTVLARARQVGITILVFGSGGARNVPEGFDRDKARGQIIDFVRMSADLAAGHGITLVAEHLNRRECNIINTIPEAMEYVRAVNHPHFQCLADSYHFWLEDEPPDNLRAAMPWIRHVHVADSEGRVPPGESGKNDYQSFFRVLKEAGYDGGITVEALNWTDIAERGPRVLEFLTTQWEQA